MGMESWSQAAGAIEWVTETLDSGTQYREADDMGQVLAMQEPCETMNPNLSLKLAVSGVLPQWERADVRHHGRNRPG